MYSTEMPVRFFRILKIIFKEKSYRHFGCFLFSAGFFIRRYYVNAVSIVGVGNVVSFSKQRDRSGAVREKEIKNELGNTNEVSAKQRFANSYWHWSNPSLQFHALLLVVFLFLIYIVEAVLLMTK